MGYSPWGRKESDVTEHTHTRDKEGTKMLIAEPSE